MAKELMEIGGFITEGAEIVNHDNSLSGNGTVNSPLGVVPGYNETVLYSATPKNYGSQSSGESITLNESISSFERLRFYINVIKGQNQTVYYESYEVDNYLGTACNFQYGPYPENNVTANWFILKAGITDNICNVSAAYNAYTSVENPYWNNKWFPGSLYKVVGINRKA